MRVDLQKVFGQSEVFILGDSTHPQVEAVGLIRASSLTGFASVAVVKITRTFDFPLAATSALLIKGKFHIRSLWTSKRRQCTYSYTVALSRFFFLSSRP